LEVRNQVIEKIKAVGNPLTIIAIFAGLAEVLGTIALKLVAADLQSTFIWFVMMFPTLIVLLFFVTLNFNNKVLYAPGDYKNQEDFLRAMWGVNRLSVDLDKVQVQLSEAKKEIEEGIKKIGEAGDQERPKLERGLMLIGSVQENIESTRESAGDVVSELNVASESGDLAPSSAIVLLGAEDRWFTPSEIAQRAGVTEQKAIATLSKLQRMGIAKLAASRTGALYKLAERVRSSSKVDVGPTS
jgi:hypothetical protein